MYSTRQISLKNGKKMQPHLRKSIIAGLVAIVTFIVYLPSLHNAFINWDDDRYISGNPGIRSLDADLVKWAFAGFHVANWHPLTWIWHYVIDKEPSGIPLAHTGLGNAYLSEGRFDPAVEQYLWAILLKPDYADAHFNLGLRYLDQGFKDMARTEFELVLTIKPDDYEARQLLNSIASQ